MRYQTVNAETLLEAFLKDFQTWEYFPQLLKDQDFQSIRFWIKETLMYTEKYRGFISF
jgi:hypothetical protein